MEILANCPICEETHFTDFIKCKDYTVSGENFQIVKCLDCDFKFTNPRPDAQEINKYYQSENYISHSNTSKGIINQVYHWVRQRTLKTKLSLINRFAGQKRLLDIGTGTGFFPKYCQENGWDITATEPDEKTREVACENTHTVIHSSIFDSNLDNQSFDVITMWHVLEHVHLLQETIQRLHQLLNDQGTLIVAVPNSDSLDAQIFKEHWAAYDLPRHLYHFSQKNIQELFDKNNFKLAEVLPMYYDAYYISLLSNRYASGSSKYLDAFLKGYKSNQWAKKNNKNYSSNIYVIKKIY